LNREASQEAAEVPVSFEQPPSIDLGQPAKTFHFQQVDGSLELGEVLLDQGIRELRERFGTQLLDDGPQSAHGSSTSNMCSEDTHQTASCL
jgi:hypothetical protein